MALDMIEAWLSHHGLPLRKASCMPSWIDALLLILDQGIRVQPPSHLQQAKVRLYPHIRLLMTQDGSTNKPQVF